MVAFLEDLHGGAGAAGGGRGFGAAGGPWEFNLRDLLRWCQLAEGAVPPGLAATPAGSVQVTGSLTNDRRVALVSSGLVYRRLHSNCR